MSHPFRRNNQFTGSKAVRKSHEQLEKRPPREREVTIQTRDGNKKVLVRHQQGNDTGSTARQGDQMFAQSRQPFFIPPDTSRTQIIQKRNQKPVFIHGVTPLPPPITPSQREAARQLHEPLREADFRLPVKEDVLALTRDQAVGGGGGGGSGGGYGGGNQYISGAPRTASTTVTVRKFISSLGKGAGNTGSLFEYTLESSFRKVIRVRFVSISIIYLVPPTQPATGFIYLVDFPKEQPFFYSSSEGAYDTENRIHAVFPVLTGTIGSTVRFQYNFQDNYNVSLITPSSNIDSLNIQILKEDLVTTPGRMIDFDDITSCNLEIELTIEKLAVA